MDGSAGPRAQSVHDFIREMLNHPAVVGQRPWIAFWDERLSTAAVRDFVDNHVNKKSTRQNAKDSGLIDRLAAQVILQGAVDYLRGYAP
ncbi:MAG: RuvX/YqgF family protein [Alphaproteobacteria bacterium]|nr:RuvX/YqgF family protein [Alphaproteobacteria bacterium]